MSKALPKLNVILQGKPAKVVLVDRFQGVADGVTFELAVHRNWIPSNETILSEFHTANQLSGMRCGPEKAYTRAKGEAAWARLLKKHGEVLVRETMQSGLASKPRLNELEAAP